MYRQKITQILLRLSIAIVLLYAAIAATIKPYDWIGFIPHFATTILPASTLLVLFSLYQVILGGWILSGWNVKYAGLLSAVTLLAIIFTNAAQWDILFRDFAIFFSSLALAISGSEKKEDIKHQ